MRKTRKNKKGFTLLEVLFVTVIIGIIVAVVVVAFSITAKEKVRIARNLKFADSVRAQLSGAPISWWKFDEGSGMAANDSWGNNNGTVNGASWTTKGVTGEALDFDSDNSDYVDVPDNPSLDLNDSFTLVAWIYSNNSADTQEIILKINTSPTWRGYHFDLMKGANNMKLRCMSHNKSGSSDHGNVVSDNPLTINQWHFVACVRDTSTGRMKLYVDGEQVKETADNADNSVGKDITNDVPLYIGAGAGGSVLNFNGSIDEVQIYGEALVAQEIQQRYAESAPRHGIALK